MSEILGLGLSHYPGPMAPTQYWSRMLSRSVEVGRVAPELYADKSRWPAPMLLEWSDDEGAKAAEAHRDRLLAGYLALAERLAAFAPDVVVIWGDDQFENFRRDCIPAFCVGIFDEVVSRPYGGSAPVFKTAENVWGLAADAELRITGHRAAATGLTRHLLDAGFDVAYAMELRHPNGLAHSFNNSIIYLDYERHGTGFRYPVIPFHVNCYGNDLMKTAAGIAGEGSSVPTPPAPSPRRCFEIGRATAAYFAASPYRAALIGSSSWSHGSLTKKHGRLFPDTDADRRRLDELRSGRFTDWGALGRDEIEDAGQHELLNWICLAGAMTEAHGRVEIVDYVESYLFNSSKCFATFTAA
jgi:hypothetical protein